MSLYARVLSNWFNISGLREALSVQ